MNNSGILPILRGKKLDTDLVEMVSERKESRFCQLIHRHLQLLPGALKCLVQHHERGRLQAIASSEPYSIIEAAMMSWEPGSILKVVSLPIPCPVSLTRQFFLQLPGNWTSSQGSVRWSRMPSQVLRQTGRRG
jgi:hypothetical protein